MQKPKIALIEDEEDIAALIKLQADISEFKLFIASDGLNGYQMIEKEIPDVIILDIMLPGQNGLDICKKIKNDSKLKHIPIIMISAKSEETDIVLGLELGADDYVAKPFSPRVLFSRIKAVLRRNKDEESAAQMVIFGEFSMEFDKYIVKKRDRLVQLTLSEFGILRRLVTNKGKVLTRNQLLDDLQSDDVFVVDRNVDVHIAALRKKLGPNFDFIETVRGVGYRFKPEE
ncbi:MAG: response regulator transcription factor [Chlamydia sp.]